MLSKFQTAAVPPSEGSRSLRETLLQRFHSIIVGSQLPPPRGDFQSSPAPLENGRVYVEWKDYADHGRTKTVTLEATEVFRRVLLHILPYDLVRIRKFGFLGKAKSGMTGCLPFEHVHQRCLADSRFIR